MPKRAAQRPDVMEVEKRECLLGKVTRLAGDRGNARRVSKPLQQPRTIASAIGANFA
jgi:hypothetical protein